MSIVVVNLVLLVLQKRGRVITSIVVVVETPLVPSLVEHLSVAGDSQVDRCSAGL